jgi:hypothetical protein
VYVKQEPTDVTALGTNCHSGAFDNSIVVVTNPQTLATVIGEVLRAGLERLEDYLKGISLAKKRWNRSLIHAHEDLKTISHRWGTVRSKRDRVYK